MQEEAESLGCEEGKDRQGGPASVLITPSFGCSGHRVPSAGAAAPDADSGAEAEARAEAAAGEDGGGDLDAFGKEIGVLPEKWALWRSFNGYPLRVVKDRSGPPVLHDSSTPPLPPPLALVPEGASRWRRRRNGSM